MKDYTKVVYDNEKGICTEEILDLNKKDDFERFNYICEQCQKGIFSNMFFTNII